MNSKRKVAEKMWLDLLDSFDSSQYNSLIYKKIFKSMTDKQFDKFMMNILNKEEYICFEIDSMNDKEQRLDNVFKVAKKLKVPTQQHVIYKSNKVGEMPIVTEEPVTIVEIAVKRLQQFIDKKNKASSDIKVRNQLTNTVTGISKSAGITNSQTLGLISTNQKNTIKELLGPRADDNVSKEQLYRNIEEYGSCSLKDLDIRPQNKQTLNTLKVMFRGVGLNVNIK